MEDRKMKKYIKPAIDIEKYGLTMEIMAGTTPQPQPKDTADGEASNKGFMGDSDDDLIFNRTNLWED